jgi:hypothetical protein
MVAGDRVDLYQLATDRLFLTTIQADPNFTNRTFAFHRIRIRIIHAAIVSRYECQKPLCVLRVKILLFARFLRILSTLKFNNLRVFSVA